MKISTLFLLVYILASINSVFAQRQNVYFLKNSGAEVKLRDSADFIRIVSEPDSGTTFYNVKEYYKSGKLKLISKTSKIIPLVLEGQCMTYYPSGSKKQYANYKSGKLDGDIYDYYPNGALYRSVQYVSKKTDAGSNYNIDYMIIAYSDSTGKQLVVDGNGHYTGYDADFKNITEEGDLKAGLKNGRWTGNNGNKTNYITYTEEYDNGKFLSGRSVDRDNQMVTYTKREEAPQYIGGIESFYRFLGQSIRYPANARYKNIQGVVLLSFAVEKDGSLTDFKIIKSPDEELSAESLRVLKKSPNWIPGQQYGQAVRVQYTVPIAFSLHH
ncbi:MAG: hypothetical protein JWQ06_2174 [Mucilaginibacter sp.]|nr:hypothetical protein [Mucilaginibacter sp.]